MTSPSTTTVCRRGRLKKETTMGIHSATAAYPDTGPTGFTNSIGDADGAELACGTAIDDTGGLTAASTV